MYADALKKDWNELFPDVPFSEIQLNRALDLALATKRRKVELEFQKRLAKQEKWIVVQNMVFQKSTAIFLGTMAVSSVTVPLLVWLMLQPNNHAFFVGATGLGLNIVTIIWKLIRMIKKGSKK